MKKIMQRLKSSLLELTVTRNMVLCGLLAALAIILGTVATIEVGPYLRIGFSGIPNRIVEFLFGPVTGCLFGGALDLLKFVLKPTGPYFFGFTFNAMISGVIYGAILYQRPVSLKRIILAEFLVKTIINCGFGTLWLSMLYGDAFLVLLPARVIKNAVSLPVDSAILYFLLT
ncbi:MAG: folate family ECF transporter S component, partial [Roseburia sp.]|nr:folate family ECF transporter S component [Roseburia sp.]